MGRVLLFEIFYLLFQAQHSPGHLSALVASRHGRRSVCGQLRFGVSCFQSDGETSRAIIPGNALSQEIFADILGNHKSIAPVVCKKIVPAEIRGQFYDGGLSLHGWEQTTAFKVPDVSFMEYHAPVSGCRAGR